MIGSLPTCARTEITLVRAGLFKLWDFETGQLGFPSTVIEHGGREYVYAVHPDFRLPDAGERRRLDASDWRVLMAVTSLAAAHGNSLEPGQVVPEAPGLWDSLGCQADAEAQPARYLATNAAEILRTAGLKPGGGQKERVLKSLTRLSRLRLTRRHPVPKDPDLTEAQIVELRRHIEYRAYLLSYAAPGNRIFVALSPLLAQRAMGEGQYLQVSLEAIRADRDDRLTLLTSLLSSRVRPGDEQRLKWAVLEEGLYGSHSEDGNRQNQRRRRIRESLKGLGATWRIEFDRHHVRVGRPAE